MDLPMEIQRLCGDFENRVIRRPEFLEQGARLVARAVGCSRAGIWIFQGEKPALRMHCLAMFDGVREQMTEVPDEEGPSVSDYFLALEQTGQVVAADARVHFATAGFFEQWLEANGVKSLLAAAFSVNGKLYGAFTCAQVGSQMEWSRSQLALLRQIGSRLSLALANADRAPTETQPALLSAPHA
jgi:GAF domain-containing protein